MKPNTEDGNRATIYSIAQEVGTSASTVSRAFSRPHMVKDHVREQIFAAAARQGYQINRVARGLATGKTGLVGVAVLDITNPFVPHLVRAIDHAAMEANLSILLLDMDVGGREPAEALRKFSSQVDGLILVAPHLAATELTQAIGSTPVVLVNREIAGIPAVLCDNTAALQQAADHLVAFGHREILLMAGPSGSWAAERRTMAIRDWGRTAPPHVRLIELGPWDAAYEAGRESVSAIMKMNATAIFSFDDYFACGVLAGLAEHGRSVPGDYSVVGCDDVLLARTVTPQLSTVSAPFEQLGKASVEMLARVMAGGRPVSEEYPGVFIARGTTGPLTESAR